MRLRFRSGRTLHLAWDAALGAAARQAVVDHAMALGGVLEQPLPGDTRAVGPAHEAGPALRVSVLDSAFARELSSLRRGEGVCCVRGDRVAEHCCDGVVRWRANRPLTEILLAADAPPSLSGALGVGLLRACSLAGLLVLHAAVVAYRGRGWLALGPSGRGKSTLAAAVLRAGGRVVSDDLVLLQAVPDAAACRGFTAHPFRDDLYLRGDVSPLLPSAAASALVPEQRLSGIKLRLRRTAVPESFAAYAALDAVAVLGAGPRPCHSAVHVLHQAAGFAAVVSALNYQLSPAAGPPLLAAAQQLVSACPVVGLDVGTELLAHPRQELERIHVLLAAQTGAAQGDHSVAQSAA